MQDYVKDLLAQGRAYSKHSINDIQCHNTSGEGHLLETFVMLNGICGLWFLFLFLHDSTYNRNMALRYNTFSLFYIMVIIVFVEHSSYYIFVKNYTFI